MQRSLQQWDGQPVTVSYKPFFLDPNIPPEGYDFLDYMHAKGGGRIPPERFFDTPRQMGSKVGLTFNFQDIPKAPNTMLAHTLIELSPEEKQGEMVEAIYEAFFEHGRDVGDVETLFELASDVGLDVASIRERLSDPVVQKGVRAEVQKAYQMGITGVPFFVINNKYAFSGAQPPEVILNVLREVVNMPKDSKTS